MHEKEHLQPLWPYPAALDFSDVKQTLKGLVKGQALKYQPPLPGFNYEGRCPAETFSVDVFNRTAFNASGNERVAWTATDLSLIHI